LERNHWGEEDGDDWEMEMEGRCCIRKGAGRSWFKKSSTSSLSSRCLLFLLVLEDNIGKE